jgi:hypothetical protein
MLQRAISFRDTILCCWQYIIQYPCQWKWNTYLHLYTPCHRTNSLWLSNNGNIETKQHTFKKPTWKGTCCGCGTCITHCFLRRGAVAKCLCMDSLRPCTLLVVSEPIIMEGGCCGGGWGSTGGGTTPCCNRTSCTQCGDSRPVPCPCSTPSSSPQSVVPVTRNTQHVSVAWTHLNILHYTLLTCYWGNVITKFQTNESCH